MTDKLNNQLNKERHNKKDMLFSFEELADEGKAAKVLDKLVKIFTKAGNGVIPEDSKASAAEMSKVKRVSGVKYREIAINFLDNQSVVLRVKESGDIYQVVLNKKVVPITHQDNQAKAIDEIIGLLNAGRTKFQAALAKQKVKLPEQSTTSRVNQVTKLTGIKDGLAAEIAQIKGETERMRGEMVIEKNVASFVLSDDDEAFLYRSSYTLDQNPNILTDEEVVKLKSLYDAKGDVTSARKADYEIERRQLKKNNSDSLPDLKGSYSNEDWNKKQIDLALKKRNNFFDNIENIKFSFLKNADKTILEGLVHEFEDIDAARAGIEEVRKFVGESNKFFANDSAKFWKDDFENILKSKFSNKSFFWAYNRLLKLPL